MPVTSILVGRTAAAMLQLLDRRDYPAVGICSHLGVNRRVSKWLVGVIPTSHGRGTLVTIYHMTRGAPAAVHDANATAVGAATGLGEIDRWNGGKGHTGISVVLDRPPPASLVAAIQQYFQMRDVFRPTPDEHAAFQRFSAWFYPALDAELEEHGVGTDGKAAGLLGRRETS